MKKSYLSWSILGVSLVLTLNSCVQTEDTTVITENKPVVETIADLVSGSENFRKSPNGVVYQEKFSNQSIKDPSNPAAFPGFGVGNSTYIGKSLSYFNQYATGMPDSEGKVTTVAAPVTEYFSDQISALGLDVNDINAKTPLVSTLTADGKGNSIWFHNVLNNAQFDQDGNISFEAQVEIVGGTGVFANATGTGTVIGNVNGLDGKGTTVLKAEINFN